MSVKGVNSGDFRTPIAIERDITPFNAAGTRPPPQWETVIPVDVGRAKVEPISSVKGLVNGAIQDDVTHLVTVLYMRGITTRCRIVVRQPHPDSDRHLYIAQPPINVGEQNHTLQLLCVEGAEATT